MDKVNQVGKKLAATQKASKINSNRKRENFPQPNRTVDSFNIIHPYTTTFSMSGKTSALLSLKIAEITTPCTVNPPILHIYTGCYLNGSDPGTIDALYSTSQQIVPGQNDFVLIPNAGVQVPLDGCYSVHWTSSAWGMSYYGDRAVYVSIGRVSPDGTYHNIRSVGQTPTGALALLGPLIFAYTPASPIWAVVECKAGDCIALAMTEGDLAASYPWYNGGLSGFFSAPFDGSGALITLVAVAEN
jgi:hypothetical protein